MCYNIEENYILVYTFLVVKAVRPYMQRRVC